jgi:hypothetical protein
VNWASWNGGFKKAVPFSLAVDMKWGRADHDQIYWGGGVRPILCTSFVRDSRVGSIL